MNENEKSRAQQIRESAEKRGLPIVKLKEQEPFTPDELEGIPEREVQS